MTATAGGSFALQGLQVYGLFNSSAATDAIGVWLDVAYTGTPCSFTSPTTIVGANANQDPGDRAIGAYVNAYNGQLAAGPGCDLLGRGERLQRRGVRHRHRERLAVRGVLAGHPGW
ncbi:MAG: hypothetical protein MZV49_08915 [Rhodopseudomonas palustris]|nr:hypothetical protein [Rhodopseudomonas palustris]